MCFCYRRRSAALPRLGADGVEETVLGPQFWMSPIESFEVGGVAALRHVRAETIAAGKAKYAESRKQEHCRHLTNAPFAPPP